MRYSTIGTIYEPTGVMLTDSEGNEYPVMVAIDGYHVNALNLSEDDVVKLTPYMVEVTSPSVVFAGRNDTVFLKFADRDEWLSMGYETVAEGV